MEQNERIYFCIDSDTLPYRGVKGKAIEMIVKDAQKAVELAERIITRYTGRVDNLVGRNLIPAIQSGTEIVIEVVPQYYSVWDYWKNNYG